MAKLKLLPPEFYDRPDVVRIARELIGHYLVTELRGKQTIGKIVETEAYAGVEDRASHAWNHRRTLRTEVMFGPPGNAYIYLCYGLHHLFNVVTNTADVPHAILIRALEPIEGLSYMAQRTAKKESDISLTRGPGNLCRALGINRNWNGYSLFRKPIYLAYGANQITARDIQVTPRIGVDYAGKDAQRPYRFLLKGSPYVSRVK